MKEFLKTNTVTHNLMVYTGFKAVLIFSLLIDGPKSYEEIINYIKKHEYLNETVSIDTIRIYLNSLKQIGCKIIKENQDGVIKYYIKSHPFELNITDAQAKSIMRIFRTISKDMDISDLLAFQTFFEKIAPYVEYDKLRERIKNISPLKHTQKEIVKELINCVRSNSEITILYNSRNTNRYKNITINCDKLYVNNGKLYLSGFNSLYKNYSSFLVSKIVKIVSFNLCHKTFDVPEITVGYEYKQDENEALELLKNEKIIKKSKKNKILVEITSKNRFEITQRILSLSNRCKVLYPDEYKDYIISSLQKMKEVYIEK
jgi:predicted DNA-binding transcriptional regulator YafY